MKIRNQRSAMQVECARRTSWIRSKGGAACSAGSCYSDLATTLYRLSSSDRRHGQEGVRRPADGQGSRRCCGREQFPRGHTSDRSGLGRAGLNPRRNHVSGDRIRLGRRNPIDESPPVESRSKMTKRPLILAQRAWAQRRANHQSQWLSGGVDGNHWLIERKTCFLIIKWRSRYFSVNRPLQWD
jgi:hypothetical protein